jgi:hypothetical protein
VAVAAVRERRLIRMVPLHLVLKRFDAWTSGVPWYGEQHALQLHYRALCTTQTRFSSFESGTASFPMYPHHS